MVFPIEGGHVGGQAEKLTEGQLVIPELKKADPTISRKRLSEILRINPSAIQKHIDSIRKKGRISRDSETTGYWEIHD